MTATITKMVVSMALHREIAATVAVATAVVEAAVEVVAVGTKTHLNREMTFRTTKRTTPTGDLEERMTTATQTVRPTEGEAEAATPTLATEVAAVVVKVLTTIGATPTSKKTLASQEAVNQRNTKQRVEEIKTFLPALLLPVFSFPIFRLNTLKKTFLKFSGKLI